VLSQLSYRPQGETREELSGMGPSRRVVLPLILSH